tara:strand:+ start:275 stop:934 length:660 start_codon:yes stop_codon:yes gene_type:complete
MSDIYNLINSIADNKLLVFILSAILGILLNFFLSLAGFNWLKTLNQRLIYIIFPPAMTVISWTIAGNLGLSLGMIGALSIVRFRTPVKSPIELVFYFVLIVIGISITVAPIYTVLIFLLTCFVPFIFRYLYKLDDGHYEFSENENELSKLSLANFVIESSVDEDFIENIKKINFKLLDLKNEETNTYNLSFEINKLDQYQELKKILSQCGKIQKSEFIL